MVLIERINKIRFLFFYSSVTEFGKKNGFSLFSNDFFDLYGTRIIYVLERKENSPSLFPLL